MNHIRTAAVISTPTNIDKKIIKHFRISWIFILEKITF